MSSQIGANDRTPTPANNQRTEEWHERPVYWATIIYLRWWWATDGVNLGLIRRSGGIFPPVLRSIALEYNVHRGIVSAKKAGESAALQFCELLNTSAHKWPESLAQRADFCVDLLNFAINKQWVHGYQISLFTKLMWFLRPDGWTPFDRFAAQGAEIKESLVRCRRMIDFYAFLERQNFPGVKTGQNGRVKPSRCWGRVWARELRLVSASYDEHAPPRFFPRSVLIVRAAAEGAVAKPGPLRCAVSRFRFGKITEAISELLEQTR